MKLKRIEALVGTVPATIDDRQRERLAAYAQISQRCQARILELRRDVERALETAVTEPDAALILVRELDDLERIQPRVDAWLRAYVAALVEERMPPQGFGEGPA